VSADARTEGEGPLEVDPTAWPKAAQRRPRQGGGDRLHGEPPGLQRRHRLAHPIESDGVALAQPGEHPLRLEHQPDPGLERLDVADPSDLLDDSREHALSRPAQPRLGPLSRRVARDGRTIPGNPPFILTRRVPGSPAPPNLRRPGPRQQRNGARRSWMP